MYSVCGCDGFVHRRVSMVDSVAGTTPREHAAVTELPGGLVGVALAAGEGRRLRPLTDLRPKPLCPVGNEALLDQALARLSAVTDALAVNLHHGGAAIEDHLDARAGVAGGLGEGERLPGLRAARVVVQGHVGHLRLLY